MTKINFTINSRVYTVVAEENADYIRRLCEHVNEKVTTVLREGNHIMGEKPLVLAALNICDEYFKLLDSGVPADRLSELIKENNDLKSELEKARDGGEGAAKLARELDEELDITRKVLDEAEEKIKFLEGQIELKEGQMKKQRTEYALREKELLDMLDTSNGKA